jgi:hypothetical protein
MNDKCYVVHISVFDIFRIINMKIFKLGDTIKAACEKCKGFEDATFKIRDVHFSDGSGTVKNILVGVCKKCGSVTVLPHQEVPLVKEQLDRQDKSPVLT